MRDEWGVTLGGLWLADTNLVAAGGQQPGGWTNNSALFISLAIDAEKLVDWRAPASDSNSCNSMAPIRTPKLAL